MTGEWLGHCISPVDPVPVSPISTAAAAGWVTGLTQRNAYPSEELRRCTSYPAARRRPMSVRSRAVKLSAVVCSLRVVRPVTFACLAIYFTSSLS